jgi:tRNA(Ile)-lysidine synthase TilS/MesJ
MSAETPAIWVVTTHGREALTGAPSDRILDVLVRNDVPWSAVSMYLRAAPGESLALTAGLDRRLDSFPAGSELFLYFNRNINPFLFDIRNPTLVADEAEGAESTEYIYQRMDNDGARVETLLKKLTPEECRGIIADRVAETIRAHVPAGETLVVGVSGGGDSNAMLHGLTQLGEDGPTIRPMIIKGIPDWDLGVPRAQALCDRYGLALDVVEEGDVMRLLGMEPGRDSLVERFEREFPGDDFEFLGTLLIRLALSKRAAELGATYVATGINLEDILCESLYRVSQGLAPARHPLRPIGPVNLVMPLWMCPKKIIDGCFPTYSRENYDARYPCFSLGRNTYYAMAYALQSQFPGMAERMVQGYAQVAEQVPTTYEYNEDLGFHVERFVPFPLLVKFRRLLKPADGA